MLVLVNGEVNLFNLFSRYGDCPSTVSVCHSYGTLRIARYYMIHNHDMDAVERAARPRIAEDFQPPPFIDGSMEVEGIFLSHFVYLFT